MDAWAAVLKSLLIHSLLDLGIWNYGHGPHSVSEELSGSGKLRGNGWVVPYKFESSMPCALVRPCPRYPSSGQSCAEHPSHSRRHLSC